MAITVAIPVNEAEYDGWVLLWQPRCQSSLTTDPTAGFAGEV